MAPDMLLMLPDRLLVLDRLLVWGMNQLAPLLDPELLPELLGQPFLELLVLSYLSISVVVLLQKDACYDFNSPPPGSNSISKGGSTGIGYRIE